MQIRRYTLLNTLIMGIMSCVYMIPFFLKANPVYMWRHDLRFHLSRILGLNTIIESPINLEVYNHNGNAINYAYPWLTIYPIQWLYQLTGNLILACNIFFLLITFLTMLVAYFSMQRIHNNQHISLIFALLYSFALYRTDDLFLRFALGESVAFVFFPLILMGCYEIFLRNYRRWYYLTIGMVGLLYSHVLSVFMASGMIALVLLITIWGMKDRRNRIIALLYATLSTSAIGAFFLIPFVSLYLNHNIETPGIVDLVGLDPAEAWDGIISNTIDLHVMGLSTAVVAVIALTQAKRFNKTDRYILALGCGFFLLTLNYFPWSLFNGTPISQLQFVFRLNIFPTLFLNYAGAVALVQLQQRNRWKQWVVLLSVCVSLAMLNASAIKHTIEYQSAETTSTDMEISDEVTLEANVRSVQPYDYANFGIVNDSNYSPAFTKTFYLDEKEITAESSYQGATLTVEVSNPNPADSILTVPIFYYQGITASIDGEEVAVTESDTGAAQVEIPSGTSTIEFKYKYTWTTTVGLTISMFTLALLVGYITVINRRPLRNTEAMHSSPKRTKTS